MMDLDIPSDAFSSLDRTEFCRELGWSAVAVSFLVDAEEALAGSSARKGLGEKRKRDLLDQLPDLDELRGSIFEDEGFPMQRFSERKRKRTGVEVYSRVNVRFSSIPAVNHAMQAPVLQLFDIIAVRVSSGDQFRILIDMIKSHSGDNPPFDVICLDLAGEKFRIGSEDMKLLRRARVFLEIHYSQAFPRYELRAKQRREAIEFAGNLLRHVSRGHLKSQGRFCNIILSSGGSDQPRSVQQVSELAQNLGLRKSDAMFAVTTSAQAALQRAERRKRFKA